jgi:hypothetical protein
MIRSAGPAWASPANSAEQKPAQRRRDQVQQIVEARRGPAERPIALCAVPDHAVERARHLVGEEARQPEQQVPEDRRDNAIAEILGQALDRSARDPVRFKAPRVAADDMPNRLPPGRQSAPLQGRGDRGDVLKQAALAEENADRQRLDRRADDVLAAQHVQRGAERRGDADQHHDRHDAALAPAPLAAAGAVELAVEEPDRPSGEHDRVRHDREDERHLAQDRVDRDAGEQQKQRIVSTRPEHGARSVGRAAAAINQQEGA